MLRGRENGARDGPLGSTHISWLAPPYADDDAGTFLSVAPEAALGEKKPQPSPCRSCGPCWTSSYPCRGLRLKACWSSSRGCSSASTKRIERIERGDKRTDDALYGALCSY